MKDIPFESLNTAELQELGRTISRKVSPGQLSDVLNGIVQGTSVTECPATNRLIEAAQYLAAVGRLAIVRGHKRKQG